LVLLLAGQSAAPQSSGEEAAVREVFDRYKAALVAGDGAAAQGLVDNATLDTFRRLRSLALDGSEQAVRELSFVERLLVVSMRHALDRSVIEEMDLATLIETAMGEGWISPQTLAQLDIGAITVEGDEAWAEARSGLPPPPSVDGSPASTGEQVELAYRFVREGGAWKFRFGSLIEALDHLVAELTAALGADEDQLIFMLVESFSGRQVLPEVWERPPGANR
jgi:hypothetical protein